MKTHPHTVATREQRLAGLKHLSEAHGVLEGYKVKIYRDNGYRESAITRRLDAAMFELRTFMVQLPEFDGACVLDMEYGQ